MSTGVFGGRLLTIGGVMTAIGCFLYGANHWIGLTMRSAALITASSVASIGLTIFGLLAALIGGAIVAWRAEPKWTFVAAIVVTLLTALLGKRVTLDVRGPSAIFALIILAGGLGATELFILAMIRFLVVRKQSQE